MVLRETGAKTGPLLRHMRIEEESPRASSRRLQHAPFFTIPLCEPHHQAVHLAITRSGIGLEYTSVIQQRARSARLAGLVFLWFLEEQLATAEKFKTSRRMK